MLPTCAVVIPTWNSAASIERCLVSVVAQAPNEICVVDNGSKDATVAIVRERFSTVRVIQNSHNQGFAVACNAGIAATESTFVLCLNDDACLRTDYIAILCSALQKRSDAASAIGKLVYERHGRQYIDSAGIEIDFWRMCPVDRGQGRLDVAQYDAARDIFGPTAAAAMYRRSALRELSDGGFDAELFAYYEDVDLAWRLGRLGWRHLYVPRAVAEHERRGPHNKPQAIAARAFTNRYRIWRKNESWRRFCAYAPICVPWEIARLARLTRRDPKLAWAILTEAWSGQAPDTAAAHVPNARVASCDDTRVA